MSHIRRLKKIKKDYQRKNLQNPFFHQRAKGKSCYWSKWFTLGLFLIFIFIIWFFLASPLFKIKNITVRGLTRSPESDIQNIIWQQTSQHRYLLFREGNIILFNKKEAQKQILGNFNFANLKIDKHWPQTLIVEVSERPYAFIFQQGNDFFYASSDAYIIKEKFVEEGDKGKYLILENKNTNNLIDEAGKINLTTNYLNFILDLHNRLVAYSDLPVERFIIDQEFNTVKVKFASGPLVYFNVTLSAQDQLKRLALVKKEKIKDNFSKVNYIDLRYGDRIFINPELP